VDELARERYDRAALREEMHRAVMERDETILETRARAADFEGLAAGRQEAVAQLEARLVERRARVDELLGELAESRAAELRRASHEARLQQLRMEDERRLRVLAADLDAQRAEVQRLASLLEETHRQLDQMVRSRSWRLMAPLRTLAALRRRLRGG
jgi:chromosome segregation ATPase